ncbi:sugar phosphate isomerase/epimerase family protein [Pedobacter metabolipauper]|uniref:Sugar phosphate isomerase/epimerase n=1 Tax=Pedobacter metabolipauper TaxID=425513 RepID=A0A4R6ST09_9SPHI|nr:sugar phosphate isomerase/epimerase family protein [Pedobacter metabolipauper]TDQ08086.1 sugar phosphate isomerase/epimerase [Pedobacter metabolipauper]
MKIQDRRSFIRDMSLITAATSMSTILPLDVLAMEKKDFFRISLAQYSFHKALFAGKMTNLEFPLKAKKDFGIDIVEYVSRFFNNKETDQAYLRELLTITKNEGIQNHLIMVDHEGDLGNLDEKERIKAVENHYKWVDAAKTLGCLTLRVNALGKGPESDVKTAVIDGLGRLTEYGKKNKINIVVENHGSYSSNGKWLSDVMKGVNSPYCGTLPDFGNFKISDTQQYDIYQGVKELMPFAKGISAKTFRFDEQGNEPDIDYTRMFKIIHDAKFRGIVGIEWEGNGFSEEEGIRKTRALLEKILEQYKK